MKKKCVITQQELDSIRFYMGDPEIVNRGDFKGGPKAYNTINALLHSGIQNELDKIREGRILEIEDGEQVRSYAALCISIYAAMEKYRLRHLEDSQILEEKDRITYRVDRESTIQELKGKNATEGFYSTCKWGFLEEYAHMKENVALIEIHRDGSVPYLDFEELFKGYYAKPEEAELLIPFGTGIRQIEEVELSDEEKVRYTDIHGNPPRAKYCLFLTGRLKDADEEWKPKEIEEIVSESNAERVKKCLRELMELQTLNEIAYEFYVKWKKDLQEYIYKNTYGKKRPDENF